jgi:hypothetical protein
MSILFAVEAAHLSHSGPYYVPTIERQMVPFYSDHDHRDLSEGPPREVRSRVGSTTTLVGSALLPTGLTFTTSL